MADTESLAFQDEGRHALRSASHPEVRPLNVRTTSEPQAFDLKPGLHSAEAHARRKSTYLVSEASRLHTPYPRRTEYRTRTLGNEAEVQADPYGVTLSSVSEQIEDPNAQLASELPDALQLLTPPVTPVKVQHSRSSSLHANVEIVQFDFSRIDYELARARCIGHGLWSSVYLAEPTLKSPKTSPGDVLTPPSTPDQKASAPPVRIFAVKTPARPDSTDIFREEAKVLSRLQLSPHSYQHIVSFHGLDIRNSSLVFEGVIGGSLVDLISRLNVMTEFARHLELRAILPRLANDLISGLRFIHAAGVVHADIKPANVLLDIIDDYDLRQPVLRARYIDFSASFVPGESSPSNAGGTWAFMAPEQLTIRKELNTPTFASDVWSLGITLLSIIVGDSPYAAACGSNLFMLREAIKSGDALRFACLDPIVQKRMAACQDFVDCCRLALQKDRDRRLPAAAWEAWLAKQ